MPYRIRHARPDELGLLAGIEKDAGMIFADVGLKEISDHPPADITYIRSFLRGGAVLLAVDEKDEPAGFALVSFIDRAGHLFELAVRRAHARKGLGARLVAASCGFAFAQGARRMTLSTFRDVQWNAPFYAKHGFRILPQDDWTPGLFILRMREEDGGLPMDRRCFMEKELSEN